MGVLKLFKNLKWFSSLKDSEDGIGLCLILTLNITIKILWRNKLKIMNYLR